MSKLLPHGARQTLGLKLSEKNSNVYIEIEILGFAAEMQSRENFSFLQKKKKEIKMNCGRPGQNMSCINGSLHSLQLDIFVCLRSDAVVQNCIEVDMKYCLEA